MYVELHKGNSQQIDIRTPKLFNVLIELKLLPVNTSNSFTVSYISFTELKGFGDF